MQISRNAANTMSWNQVVQPPPPFDFKRHEDWPKWIRRFERYRIASEMNKRNEELQINTLVYTMGDEADDIFKSFRFESPDHETKYDKVREQFDNYFVVKRNTIFERSKFNMRKQETQEPVDAFITDLYCLSEYCEYGALRDEMIRDRIVVGLRDMKLSEKLQLDPNLTLEKAINAARQSEAVKKQQETIRETPLNLDAVTRRGNRQKKQAPYPQDKGNATKRQKSPQQQVKCTRCGSSEMHNREKCPAKDASCRKCSKRGHYARCCRSYVNEVSSSPIPKVEMIGDLFLGELQDGAHGAWNVDVLVDGN